MRAESLDFLRAYINNASPVSFEQKGQRMWLNYIKPYTDTYFTDNYGSAVAVINPDHKFKVMIEAHADEISFYVNYISADGMVIVRKNGGVDARIAYSKTINFYGSKGIVKGVVGIAATHVRADSTDKSPMLDDLSIDLGASSKEEILALGVDVGTVGIYTDEFFTLNDNYLGGRAFDNRIGGFMIAEVARLIHENKNTLPFGLYITNSVQEEVGLYGAKMVVNSINPDVAIVTDVIFDTSTPGYDVRKHGDTKCGLGPAITYAPSVHNNVRELIEKTAKENDIKYQKRSATNSTGTDTDSIAFSGKGVPSALISLPLRYMHTTVELVHRNDVEQTIKLMYKTLLNIKDFTTFKYEI